jgi:hypothetical protein
MDVQAWTQAISIALGSKLSELAVEFSHRSLERLDIGVFPWHGAIEISMLFPEDQCDRTSTADWPHYNVASIPEGKWMEAVAPCQAMLQVWERDHKSSETFFRAAADAVRGSRVAEAIERFTRTSNFLTTLYDPDNNGSVNYCA